MTFDELVSKIGQDKILHFLVGSLITAFMTLVIGLQEPEIGWSTMSAPVIGLVVTAFFGFVKEKIVDTEFDVKDLIATVLGSVPIFLATFLGVLFHILSI